MHRSQCIQCTVCSTDIAALCVLQVDTFLGEIDAADGDAYSSIFVPTGGGTTPEYWLKRSKKEVAKSRDTLSLILELK